MLGKWISNLFARKPVLVKGGAKVAEGEARSVDLGDPHAGGTRLLLCNVEGEIRASPTRGSRPPRVGLALSPRGWADPVWAA